MLQYLVILLDDTSVSYCHYENTKTTRNLIGLDDLKAGIFFAMKQNLMIQFVYPDGELPEEYHAVIESIDHHRVMPASQAVDGAEVIVLDRWDQAPEAAAAPHVACVARADKSRLFRDVEKLAALLGKLNRINVVLTDADTFTDTDFDAYKQILSRLADALTGQYAQGRFPQLNILTDRVLLDRMNNCNAGVENITLAPNGKFYICPAFYHEDDLDAIGNPVEGVAIRNRQLYRIDYAPLCRRCDAYQCRRCVWLNRKTTLEVNTPSHEQCVMAHLERNKSREWLNETAAYFPGREIAEIRYLDPFDASTERLDF
ncbi:MAG: CXXX repeat peptide maturase [Bacteroidales bacterium]|jgi:CXXX repeat peptide maturase|nr:CXXX repeat peptide maturase [Bacteroidales bacterium]